MKKGDDTFNAHDFAGMNAVQTYRAHQRKRSEFR